MRAFVISFVGLVALTLVAWAIRPGAGPAGKVPLVWVSDDNPARREQIALFNRLHPACDLSLDPDNNGMEKVIVQSVGGVGPDLFDCYSPFQLSSYVKAAVAWDLTDALVRAGVDVRRDVWDVAKAYVIYEGRVYGFPTNACTDALWFNKEIFDQSGIPYPRAPWTWEEFLPLAKRLTVREANGRIRHFGFSFDSWAWKFFLTQWGGHVYSEDGTRCLVDAPEAIAAVEFMHDLIYKHKVMPSPSEEEALAQQGGWGSSTIKFLGAGRLATAIGGRWWLCTLRNYEGLRLGAVESPHGPLRRYWSYARATLVNQSSPHRAEAVEFIRYLSGPEYNRLINQQADGLGPTARYATGENLVNPRFPDEDFHAVFRDVMAYGVPDETSPFVNAAVVDLILTKQLDLVRRDAKPPADAMRTAAQEIRREMAKTLQRDPALCVRYEALTGRGRP